MEVMSMIALGHKLYNISEFMEEIMKKRFFAGLLAAMMALSATGCSGSTEETAAAASEAEETAAAQAEESSEAESSEAAEAPELSGTMKVVATSEDYVTLFDKFTEETGVKVELLSMSSGEVLSKLRAEGGTPSADLWFGGGIDAFMSAKDDGLLEQVNFDAAADLSPE